ncbi:hypothetical protein [Salegentibacter maritimus]|uniref:YjbR protein n=1 Tax=Salegentibacter maritimus TaxID=2794347 RepID=A0ABS0TFY4_9FLAO|nr:hypothetical protein [Salegentibacter maritimus]MBI6119547.1 hypothetical protein [Salegentibacter maritimus]
MASYLNTNEIRLSLQQLVKQYVEECESCKQLSDEFVSLIKHNFCAKYVYYNKDKQQIEIGIEASEAPDTYPDIKIYKFPVKKAVKWLDKSFKDQKRDLEFYGKLLNRNDNFNSSEIVLMNR